MTSGLVQNTVSEKGQSHRGWRVRMESVTGVSFSSSARTWGPFCLVEEEAHLAFSLFVPFLSRSWVSYSLNE